MNNVIYILVQIVVILAVAPLVNGINRKVKALSQKRKGAPPWQMYFDLYKLLKRTRLNFRCIVLGIQGCTLYSFWRRFCWGFTRSGNEQAGRQSYSWRFYSIDLYSCLGQVLYDGCRFGYGQYFWWNG